MQPNDGVWAIEAQFFSSLKTRLGTLHGRNLAVLARAAEAKPAKRSASMIANGVAVIPLLGAMLPAVPWYYGVIGVNATSTTQATKAVAEAVADDKVKGIFLYIDSPGGRVDGTEQLAEAVWQANGKKKVIAAVNNMCCSAAYWVASQASVVTANPAATVGSIGCVTSHEDWSRMYANEGVDVTVFASGPAKGAGYHHGAPLTEAGRAEIQRMVDDYGAMFTRAVSRGRKRDAGPWSTGATWRANDAMNMGVIDKLAYANHMLELFTASLQEK